jgi:molybdate transport system permease protein
LAFARALGEFGATILVAGNLPGHTTTLPVAIFQSIEIGHDGEATTLMLYSVALSFLALWISGRIGVPAAPRARGGDR